MSMVNRGQIVGAAVAAMLTAGSQTGCFSGAHETVIDTKVRAVDGAAQIESLIVLANMRDKRFSSQIYEGFQQAMTSMLSKCHVTSTILHREANDTDLVGMVVRKLQPAMALTIDNRGSYYLDGVRSVYTLSRVAYFEFNLADSKSTKVVWKANVSFFFQPSPNDKKTGADLAVPIMRVLRGLGLLKRCPYGQISP